MLQTAVNLNKGRREGNIVSIQRLNCVETNLHELTNHTFSHTSHTSGRGGGTSLQISNKWKYNQLLPIAKYSSFQYHAILVTAPVNIFMVVVYRQPGQLGDFLDIQDTLLSSIPKHDYPIMVPGDMNIHLDSPNSSDFLTLMHLFERQLVCSPPTHKACKELDLTRNCALSVTPLHFSDHYFIHVRVSLPGRPTTSTPMVSFCRNLLPTHFSSLVVSALPTCNTFSSLEVNEATETLCSTLSSCLDSMCPLSTLGLMIPSDRLRTNLRAAARKKHESKDPADLTKFQALLSSFSASVTNAKKGFLQ